ncbi:hypothetical protein BDR07DRAFT_1410804 [Suillus spraguei]|nr:hypothetical protein BDR07DRAFT_1410804 [Suillus spraguei]
MWNWATNETWFPKVQAAALAADQPCTRINGKVVNATADSQIVEFSVAVTADRENPIRDGKVSGSNISCRLSYCNQSLQKKVQDSPKMIPRTAFSSRLFDYHQGDEVIRMLQH